VSGKELKDWQVEAFQLGRPAQYFMSQAPGGSGKSLLMVFAALKLRLQESLHAPTVIIVVDRIDLDTQITATFNATDVPNLVPVENRAELERLLAQGARKVILIGPAARSRSEARSMSVLARSMSSAACRSGFQTTVSMVVGASVRSIGLSPSIGPTRPRLREHRSSCRR